MDKKEMSSKLEDATNKLSETDFAKKHKFSASKIKKIVLFGTPVAIISIGLILFSGNSVDCASSDARDLVAQIAQENEALVNYIRWNGSEAGTPVAETCEQNAQCQSSQQAFDSVQRAAVNLAQKCLAIQAIDEFDYCPEISEESQNFTSVGADGWGTRYEDEGSFEVQNSARKSFMSQNAGTILKQWSVTEAALRAAQSNLDADNIKRKDDAWKAALENIAYNLENIILTKKDKEVGSVSCKARLNADIPGWGGAHQEITYKVEKTSEGEIYATVWGI
jgi:hypothetical protein